MHYFTNLCQGNYAYSVCYNQDCLRRHAETQTLTQRKELWQKKAPF